MEVRALSEVITLLKNQKGLTLIELLITLALIGLVVGIINQVYLTQFQSFKVTEEKAKLIKEAKEIQDIITKIGLESSGIDDIWANNRSFLKENQIEPHSSTQQLSLMTSNSKQNLFKYDESTQTIYLDGDKLSEKVIGFYVYSLNGTYQETKAINVKLMLQSKHLRKTINYETEFTIMFRNK